MSPAAPPRLALDRYALIAFSLIAVVAVLLSPLYTAEQLTTLIAHSGLVLGLCGLYGLLVRVAPPRPIHLGGLVVLFGAMQPVSLLLATLLEGEVTYLSSAGLMSHHYRTLHVALVFAVFYAAFGLGTLLAGVGDRATAPGWRELTSMLSPVIINVSIVFALLIALIRFGLLFNLIEPVSQVVAYFCRLLVAYFSPVMFFLGIGLRRRYRSAVVVASIASIIYVLVLISGNRGDALVPGFFAFIGALVAAPLSRRRMVVFLSIGFVAAVCAMFVGGLLRGDQLGRSGDAGLERLNKVGQRLQEEQNVSGGIREETIRRFLRNSNHAVLTLIPDFLPYESDGLAKLPDELFDALIPGLHFSGQSDEEIPRNWMLNELGFLVNWNTSVELSLIADAWYRGGFAAVALIGFALGGLLQLIQRFIYGRMRSSADWQFLLLFAVATVWLIEGRDFVYGVHTLAFNLTAGALFVIAIRFISLMLERPTDNISLPRSPAMPGRGP